MFYFKSKLVLLFFLTGSAFKLSGQSARLKQQHAYHHLVHLTLLELSGYASINYEGILLHHRGLQLAARLGLGSYQLKDFSGNINPNLIVPLMVYQRFGRQLKIETGIGMALTADVLFDTKKMKAVRSIHQTPCASLGLVYQPEYSQLFFRLAYTPMLVQNNHIRHYGGLALGYFLK